MKWIRPSGSEIETNDEKATIEHCEKQGWERVLEDTGGSGISTMEEVKKAGDVMEKENERQLREGAIAEAMTMIMSAGDEKMLIANGMPDVRAIKDYCGHEVTAEERNNVYSRMKKKG